MLEIYTLEGCPYSDKALSLIKKFDFKKVKSGFVSPLYKCYIPNLLLCVITNLK